ncbi:MAG: SdrD B-like domain-containing protein, partial [Chthoniobacteraceae bacterium]
MIARTAAALESAPRKTSRKKRRDHRRPLLVEALEARIAPAATVNLAVNLATDLDADGVPDPGDRLHYTVTVQNTGPGSLSGMSFTELLNDPNLALVANSINVSPLAIDDAFTGVRNTLLRVGGTAGSGPEVFVPGVNVVSNDFEFLGDSFTLMPIVNGLSAGGGTVNLASDGTFTYLPAAGFAGASDTFTYTLTDDGIDGTPGNADDLTGTGTVTINFGAQEVWYVDSAFAGTSDGRSTNPFKTLGDVSGATGPDGVGDIIYVNSGSYTGGITLLGTQTLHGENTALVVGGINVAAAGAAPTLAPGAGAAVTLASNNTLTGFTIGNSQRDILGLNFGTLTVSNVTLNGTGKTLDLENGSFTAGSVFNSVASTGTSGLTTNGHGMRIVSVGGSVNLGSTSISGTEAQAVFVNNSTLDINFGNTTIGTGTAGSGGTEGFRIEANPSGTYTIGTLSIQNTPGRGFQLFGNGAPGAAAANATIMGAATISGTGSDAVLVQNTAGNASFQSLSINASGARGIALFNATGSFTTTGGTITSVTGTDVDITGTTNTGTVTIAGSITNTVGGFINIDNHETGNVTFSGNLSTTTSGISVANSNSGTITFSGGTKTLSTGAATAVNLTGNGGGTINFTGGGLAITTTSGAGFSATGGGTITVQGTANTIASTTGTALNVASTTIGAGGLTFRSIASNGAASGIVLNATGAGGFTISGDGGGTNNGSGGTIQNSTGVGISLTSTGPVSLGYVNVANSGTDGIRGSGINGFTLNRSNVTDTANGGGDDEGVELVNTSGAVAFTNSSITGATHNGIELDNFNTNMASFTMTGTTIDGSAATALGNDGILLVMRGNSVLPSGVISGSTFNGMRSVAVQIQANDSGRIGVNNGAATVTTLDATNSFVVQTNNFTGNGLGVDIGSSQVSNVTFQVLNNTFVAKLTAPGAIPNQASSHAINAFTAAGADTGPAVHSFVGKIQGNVIGTQGVKDSGSGIGSGIRAVVQGQSTQGIITIDTNTIREVPNANIISIFGQNGNATISTASAFARFKITNNVMPAISGSNLSLGGPANQPIAENGIFVLADEGFPVSAVITGNNIYDVTTANGISDIYLAVRTGPPAGAQLRIEGTGTVSAFTLANNTLAGPVKFIDESNNSTLVAPGSQGSYPLFFAPSAGEPVTPPAPGIEAARASEPVVVVPPPPAVDGTRPVEQQPAVQTPVIVDDGILSQAELDSLVDAAITRWEATGLTPEQSALLHSISFSIADLPGWYLGESGGGSFTLDRDAAGNGWFVDSTPLDDAEFANGRATINGGAAGRVDALTTVLHELGHVLGLGDRYAGGDAGDLMYGFLSLGDRRLPVAGQADGAVPHAGGGLDFLFGSMSLGSAVMPAGKGITIVYDATINAALSNGLAPTVASQVQLAFTDGTPQTANSNTQTTTLDSLTLGDLVFRDNNRNGVFDAGDAGVNGVTLSLFVDADNNNVADTPGTPLLTTTTAGGGLYSFAGLLPGNYLVRVDQSNFNTGGVLEMLPLATAFAGDPDIGDPDVDNDNNGQLSPGNGAVSRSMTLVYNTEPTAGTGNDTNNTLDFGFKTANSVGDRVWADINNDGVQDAGEAGLNGVSVELLNSGNSVIATTVTAGDGNYTFGGLDDGSFSVRIVSATLPATATPTYDLDGIGTANIATFMITGGVNNTNVDFGYRGAASVGDRLWADRDGDGVQGVGEAGFNGVTVELLNSGGTVIATATTAGDGNFTFGNLFGGSYSARVVSATLPAGVTPTYDLDGIATAHIAAFTLTAGQMRTDVDFGYRGTASVGDRLWQDSDGNGVQDGGEPGYNGVTIELLSGVTVIDSVATSGDGNYTFANLLGGSYSVRVVSATLPVGVAPTYDLDGIGTAHVAAFTLTGGQNRADVDFGYRAVTDLAITKTDGVTSAVAGGSVTYTITASNAGPNAVTGATIADTFDFAKLGNVSWTAVAAGGATGFTASAPTGTTNINDTVTMPVGSSITYTVVGNIRSNATGSLVNTATVTAPASVTDTNTANNSATDTDSLTRSADLQITKTDGKTSSAPGVSNTYTIVVTNAGPSDVATALIQDTFPANFTVSSWTAVGAGGATVGTTMGMGNINDSETVFPSGGSVTYTVNGTINAGATGTLSNTATVTAPGGVTEINSANNSATDTTQIITDDLSVTKTDGSATAVPGTTVTYTVVVANGALSTQAANGATVADTFDASKLSNVMLTSIVPTNGASSPHATGAVSGPFSDMVNLPINSTITYTFTATVLASATGSLANTATITAPGGFNESDTSNNSATDTNTLTPQGDLAITKTDGVTTAVPGGFVTYTITASNSGPSNVVGATVSDLFPAALTGVTWTSAGAGGGMGTASGSGDINDTVTLPVGGSVTYTVMAPISASASGSLSNTATITAPGGFTDLNGANDSATDTDTLTPQADLAITKTDGVTTAVPGGSVTYTITVSNSGLSDVIGATVSDTFPAALTATWTSVGAGGGTGTAAGAGNINDTVNLPVGGSVTYTVNALIAPSATGTLSNTATITAPGGVTDANPGNNSATDTDTLTPQADLAITKTDGVTTAVPGGSVTYTIVVSNSGLSDVIGATVADIFPAALTSVTWMSAGAGGGSGTLSGSGDINDTVNLPAGGSVTYTVMASIDPSATGTLSNTATITAPGGVTDPNSANNSATDTDTLTAQADLAITKTDGVTTAFVGGSVTYTITVSNSGPSNVVGALITDVFPSALTGVTWTSAGAGGGSGTASGNGDIIDPVNLPSGGSVTYTVSGSINPSATGVLSNSATISAPGGVTDLNPGNNSATDSDVLLRQSDLSIIKNDSPDPVGPGAQLTYTIVVSNAGPSDNTSATIMDVFPAGFANAMWTADFSNGGAGTASGMGDINEVVTGIPAGGSVTYTVTGTITAAANTTLSNTATLVSGEDTNSENNSDTATTFVGGVNLSVTKSDGVTSVVPGSTLTYTINYANSGFQDAPGVVLTETLPAGATFNAGASTAGWTETAPGSGVYTLAVGTLAGTNSEAGSGTAVFVVGVVGLAPAGLSQILNTTTIDYDGSQGADTDSSDNTATDSDTLDAAPDLAITKTTDLVSVPRGQTLAYTLNYQNTGNQDATGVTLRETVPAGTFFNAGASTAGWTLAADASGDYVLVVGNVGAGAAAGTATFAVSVSPVGPNLILNTASIGDDSENGADQDSEDNTASLTVPIYTGIFAASTGRKLKGDRGAEPRVIVYDAATGIEVLNFLAYEPTTAAVFTAIGDFNGDGYDDIATSIATKGSGRVRLWDGRTGERLPIGSSMELAPFAANAKGAVVSVGDLTGDGREDLIISDGFSLRKVRVYDGVSGDLLTSFRPFGTVAPGAHLAVADFDGDGRDDLIASRRDGRKVIVFDGAQFLATPTPSV